ncbi:magnesium/cobalt transporter CorA [Ancylomarina sp. DW003]|nr:magnesium/cobalt transporter CorA [Ancylomarina sp. DW003]MDE5421067.1 magnesium/cobalt transporter CorA [Ancylomarina sp. DW003]
MAHKKIKRNSAKKGLHPGALVHIGHQYLNRASVQVVKYNASDFSFKEYKNNLNELAFETDNEDCVTWVNLKGIDVKALENIGAQFKVHNLVLEDILNTYLRPKFEVFEDYCFLSLKMALTENDILSYGSIPVHFVLGKNFILSFIDSEEPIFDSAIFRLKNQTRKIRSRGADYLLFALTDLVVDCYFELVETGNDTLESLDEYVAENASVDIPASIRDYRRVLLRARRSILPLKEVYGEIIAGDLDLIDKENIKYFRDTEDHVLFVIDQLDFLRDNLSAINDSYQSIQDNQLNKIMKLLTLVATIFIPLTFLAGIYGMNFSNMPELNHQYGYFYLLTVMLILAIGMTVWFKKKKWL